MAKIKIRRVCPRCNKESFLEVEEKDYTAWRNGLFAQIAFPYLSADERETIITGYHGVCWDLDFGGLDESDV